jgi:hypothetical protein
MNLIPILTFKYFSNFAVNKLFQISNPMRLHFKALLIAIFFLCNINSQGQCVLALKHNEIDKSRFYKGSEIHFLLANFWYDGIIDSLNQNYFFLGEVPVPIKEIQAIKIYRKGLNYLATGGMLIAGGVFLFAIDGINDALSNGKNGISTSAVVLSTSAIVVGLVMLPFNSRVFKMNEKNKLVMICL